MAAGVLTRPVWTRPVRTVLIALVALAAVLDVPFSATGASADPIILGNFSAIFGNPIIIRPGDSLQDAFEERGLPLNGAGTLSDTRTVSASGAMATVSSSVTTDLSSSHLAGSGQLSATTVPSSSSFVAFPRLDGASVLSVAFSIFEPHAFTFAGEFSSNIDVCPDCFFDQDGNTLPLGAFLLQEGVFHVLFRMPFLPPFGPSGQFRRQHSGVLDAGTYNLFASAGAAFGGGDSHAVLGYSIALDLAPTPEPSTLALLGTAAIGLAGSVWRRRKQRL
jgi:hypothetical protein